MKPFLSIDLTVDKDNETHNGREFLTVETPELQLELLAKAEEQTEIIENKVKMPLPLKILVVICSAAVIVFGFFFELLEEEEGNILLESYPWALPVAIAAVLVIAACFIYTHIKKKKYLETDEAKHLENNLDTSIESVFSYNGVPGDAVPVDILFFTYKVKNGEPVETSSLLATTLYMNCEMRAYRKSDAFCLADLDGIYEFPLNSLKRIRKINKRITMPLWNKETPHNKPPYKEFSVSLTSENNYSVKPYYILEVEHNGEIHGIYFPPYELSVFQRITGLSPDPEENKKK